MGFWSNKHFSWSLDLVFLFNFFFAVVGLHLYFTDLIRESYKQYEIYIIRSAYSHFSLYYYNIRFFYINFISLVKNCNHKRLGIYYLLSAFIFGISGTLISVLMRIELYSSGSRVIAHENVHFYNVSITLHGFLMIFFLVMPGLFAGFGNYFVPIFQGSPEVVYPRMNNFSILVLILSYFILILSVISEFGSGSGWTLYPPLSTSFMNLSVSSTAYLIFGLLFSGISSCATSVPM